MSAPVIVIPKPVQRDISNWAEKAYPKEGCGLLIGKFEPPQQKKVVRFAPLTNELLVNNTGTAPTLPKERQGEAAGTTEFVMSPAEFNRETLSAEKEGLDVVGVVHTHPDHPPKPSQIDASQPFLSSWSNIIVAVHQGKTVDMKSWFRDEDNKPFLEELIQIKGD